MDLQELSYGEHVIDGHEVYVHRGSEFNKPTERLKYRMNALGEWEAVHVVTTPTKVVQTTLSLTTAELDFPHLFSHEQLNHLMLAYADVTPNENIRSYFTKQHGSRTQRLRGFIGSLLSKPRELTSN